MPAFSEVPLFIPGLSVRGQEWTGVVFIMSSSIHQAVTDTRSGFY